MKKPTEPQGTRPAEATTRCKDTPKRRLPSINVESAHILRALRNDLHLVESPTRGWVAADDLGSALAATAGWRIVTHADLREGVPEHVRLLQIAEYQRQSIGADEALVDLAMDYLRSVW